MQVTVIGLGSAGARHADHLLALGHQVQGYDPGPAVTPAGVTRTTDLAASLESCDAAVVASPNVNHAEHALTALSAGCHVLVEKPLALDAASAGQVAEAAVRAGRVCAVGMNLRFHPGVVALRELVRDGALGQPRLSRFSFGFDLRRWRPDTDYRASYSARAELGGGILLDAIHELDYLLWLLGPAEGVSGHLARLSDLEIDVEDTVLATVELSGGGLAAVDLNFFEPSYRRGCLIAGDRAVAQWDWNAATVTVSGAGAGETTDVSCDLARCYRAVVADFIEAIEQGREPRTPAADGVSALALCDALRASSARGVRVALQP